MKILPIITPIITLLLSLHVAPKHIYMQIGYSVDKLYILWKPIYVHFTHILHKAKWKNTFYFILFFDSWYNINKI